MDKKYLIPVISIAAVIIFFIWGTIEKTYSHAWMIFLVAGLLDVIVAGMKKKDSEKKE